MNIVAFLNDNWEREHRRPHLEGFARYGKLLCVEQPVTIDYPVRKSREFVEWSAGRRGIRQISENLYVYKPVSAVPYAISLRTRALTRINRWVLGGSLRGVVSRAGMSNIVTIIGHPAQEYVIGMLGEKALCYEAYDPYAEAAGLSWSERRRLADAEERIARRADIIFASASGLADEKRRMNPNTYLIPNGADVEFFAGSGRANTPIPDDLAAIREPRIGLIGHINDIVDIELVNYVAVQRPEWSIVLIGAVNGSARFARSASFLRSQSLHNVHYLGLKDYETLPNYQRGLNVCLLPYKINNYTKYVYPSKLHQYLAGGKPVVSTDLPDMRPFADVIDIARDHPAFLMLVQRALEDGSDPAKLQRRMRVARENSSEKRCSLKADLLREVLEGRRATSISN